MIWSRSAPTSTPPSRSCSRAGTADCAAAAPVRSGGYFTPRALRPRMEIRGERECKDCGTRWSYYETGSVACPNCESVRSVGVDEERKRHTAGQATLDLTEVRNMIDAEPED